MTEQQQHPITPPPELRRLWAQQAQRMDPHDPVAWLEHVATQAARWGADQELQALLIWLRYHHYDNLASDILAAMRPKPPSLAEQALAQTNAILDDPNRALLVEVRETLELSRRALKRLQELEKGND